MTRASVVAVVLLGCGGVTGATIDGSSGDDAPPDASIPPGFTELIGRDFGVGVGATDTYLCRKIQVDHDMWISAFRTMSPLGTHHQIITVSDNATDLGDYPCSAGVLDPKMLYAGGIDTDDLTLPDGVAVHVVAGQYLNLNLHLFDATDNPLSGHSAVLVKTIDASQVVNEADVTFAGARQFAPIPAGAQMLKVEGGCSIPAGPDWNVFALWPHMHKAGVHQTDILAGSAKPMLLDVDYSFTEQRNYNMGTTVFHPNDSLIVDCYYDNPTGQPIPYGTGSDAEMCLVGVYRWPVIEPSDPYQCVTN
jgi:hypothetical protein